MRQRGAHQLQTNSAVADLRAAVLTANMSRNSGVLHSEFSPTVVLTHLKIVPPGYADASDEELLPAAGAVEGGLLSSTDKSSSYNLQSCSMTEICPRSIPVVSAIWQPQANPNTPSTSLPPQCPSLAWLLLVFVNV